ncbi:MAG: esterase/lipase family protein [Isosphaeraceae bacterium]
MSRLPEFPVVFCHGLFGTRQYGVGPLSAGDYFRVIRQEIASLGVKIVTPRVHPTAGVHRRVWMLSQRILAECGDSPIHLVGHSMGGIDMRLLANEPAWASRIISMTSIGTPHLGTSLADLAGSRLGLLFRGMERIGWSIDGFRQVSPAWMRDMTTGWADPPHAVCRSIAGNPDPSPGFIALRPVHRMVYELDGPNDGMVPMESALGWGEPLPPWPFDHLQQINWMTSRRKGREVIEHYIQLVVSLGAIEEAMTWPIPGEPEEIEPELAMV